MTLHETITATRKGLSLNQKQLAERMHVSPSYINDIEHGRRSPSTDAIISRFAVVLKIDADYLHYLNGKFPQKERTEKLTRDKFVRAMAAFRSAARQKP